MTENRSSICCSTSHIDEKCPATSLSLLVKRNPHQNLTGTPQGSESHTPDSQETPSGTTDSELPRPTSVPASDEGVTGSHHRPVSLPLVTNVPPKVDADLVILGGGSAAFAAAIEAHQLGARVIIVERSTLGGTCVNIGCVPSKFLLRAAEVAHLSLSSPYRGIKTSLQSIDLAALVQQKQELIAELRREKYEELIDFYGWDLLHGEARFLDPTTIQVNGYRIRGRFFLIATGARPALPPLPGLSDVPFLTSTTALELQKLPASLLILGAGYIALELGQAFQRLGTEVTLFQRRPQLLPTHESRLAKEVEYALTSEGLTFRLGSRIQRVERTPEGIRLLVISQNGQEEYAEGEALLVATGRQPNTEALDLAKAGVEIDERGAPLIDSTLRTTNPYIYAAGDVTHGPQFVYVAAAEGRLAAQNALLGRAKPIDLSAVPTVIFTDPQVASVGLTEQQALAAGYEVMTGFAPATIIARERVNFQSFGGVLVVAESKRGQVLGVHAVASSAGELIEAATLAVAHRLTLDDLRDHFAPYLTSSEGLRLAALSITQDIGHLSCCA